MGSANCASKPSPVPEWDDQGARGFAPLPSPGRSQPACAQPTAAPQLASQRALGKTEYENIEQEFETP
ncbi:MAG: hypothetical protein ACJAYU_002126 [Bradymonadia bacterium]|jgi:hypothetical protein